MSIRNQATEPFDYDWGYSSRVAVLFILFTTVAVVGWLVSTLLTAIHLFALPAIPADAPIQGSIQVISSQWAYAFGVPLATFGAIYYLSTIGLALWWFDTRHPLVVKILTPITATGVAFSAYFVYLQLFVIGAICPFCMVSATATVILLGLELLILRSSETPALSTMTADLGALLGRTNYALIVFPVLIGVAAIAGLFMIPQLPLPDVIPFV